MEKEIRTKLYKKTAFTFVYSFIWIFALSLIFQILQALSVVPIYIKASYLYPMAIAISLIITFLRMKKFVKKPELLEL